MSKGGNPVGDANCEGRKSCPKPNILNKGVYREDMSKGGNPAGDAK